MTRTILNWSELLKNYRGESIEKRQHLKKWSEMDRADPPKQVKLSKSQPSKAAQEKKNKLKTKVLSKPSMEVSGNSITEDNGNGTNNSIGGGNCTGNSNDNNNRYNLIEKTTATGIQFKIVEKKGLKKSKSNAHSIDNEILDQQSDDIQNKELEISLPEIFYDHILLDSKTIPELERAKNAGKNLKPKLSKRDSLLFDLLVCKLQ